MLGSEQIMICHWKSLKKTDEEDAVQMRFIA
jgi:hypothetical protein